METLDPNAIDMDERKLFAECGWPFLDAIGRLRGRCQCQAPFVFTCTAVCFSPPTCSPMSCDGPFTCPSNRPLGYLTEALKACAGEFYDRCKGFERIEKYCEFEPAIEAARFKEQALLDRIAALEARVQELELKPKR